MEVLNLYAGVLGNAHLWQNKDLNITHVELNPLICDQIKIKRPNDTVLCEDAHQYLLDHYKEYDFIWSSPPCQTHSKMMKATRHDVVRYADMKLYQEILLLTHFFKGKFCIENVESYYNPLIEPQKIGRHFFWSNFKITSIKLPKIKDVSRANRKQIAEYLGFDYQGQNIYLNGNHCPAQILRNCVHPKLGEHILNQVRGIHMANNSEQHELNF